MPVENPTPPNASAPAPAAGPQPASNGQKGPVQGGQPWVPLRQGQILEDRGHKVECLICDAKSFVVYLDENLDPWHWYYDGYWPEGVDAPLPRWYLDASNRVNALESVPLDGIPRSSQLAFRKLVASGMARALEERRYDTAKVAFDEAERFITELRANTHRARALYILVATLAAVVIGLAGLLLWLYRTQLAGPLDRMVLMALVGSSVGCLGAYLSVLLRFNTMTIQPEVATWQHGVTGAARLLAGTIGAGLVAAAMQANVLLGFGRPDENGALFILGCAVAGFSERMVPALMGQLENHPQPRDAEPSRPQGMPRGGAANSTG